MATFTVNEINSMMTHFNNTSVAGDTLVNNTSGLLRFVLGKIVQRGSVTSLEPDYDTLIEILPGKTAVAADGDYFTLQQGEAMNGTYSLFDTVVT